MSQVLLSADCKRDCGVSGGKGAQCAKLIQLGLPVPDGLVVPISEYRRHLDLAGVTDKTSFEEARSAIIRTPLSNEVNALVESSLNTWGSLCVRSSFEVEDSVYYSCSGIFDSFQNRKTAEEIGEGIKRVWASLWTPHSFAYLRKRALVSSASEFFSWGMAVLLMRQIDCSIVGTFAKREEDKPHLLVELVSVSRPSETVSVTIDTVSKGVVRQPSTSASSSEEKSETASFLTEAQVASVIETAIKLETNLGSSFSVEFGFSKGTDELFVFQANTFKSDDSNSIQFEPPEEGMWLLDNTHYVSGGTHFLVDCIEKTSERGASLGIAQTGMMWKTLRFRYIHGFLYSSPVPLMDPEAARARIQQAENWWTKREWEEVERQFITVHVPSMRQASESILERMHSLSTLDDSVLSDTLQMAADALSTGFHFHHLLSFPCLTPVGDYLATAAAWTGETQTKLMNAITLTSHTPLSNCNRNCADNVIQIVRSSPEVAKRLAGVSRASDEEVLSFLEGEDELGRALQTLLSHCGKRSLGGYDLSILTVEERPVPLLRNLLSLALSPDTQESGSEAMKRAQAELRGKVPETERENFDSLVAAARLCNTLREKRSFECESMPLGLTRLILLEVGRRFVQRGFLKGSAQALDLSLDEITTTLLQPSSKASSGNEKPSWVADDLPMRRLNSRPASASMCPPVLGSSPPPPDAAMFGPHVERTINALGLAFFAVFGGGLAPPSSPSGEGDEEQSDSKEEEDALLKGLAGAEGTAEGSVCLIRTPDDINSIAPGSIAVVAMQISGCSTSFLSLCRGVVCEFGGILSHLAALSRELKIPCVVSAKDATSVLKAGQHVRIDGTSGLVFAASK